MKTTAALTVPSLETSRENRCVVNRRHAMRFLLLFSLCPSLFAQVIPLWPDEPPQFLENASAEVREERGTIRNVTVPSITLFLPAADKRNGMAVIVWRSGRTCCWSGCGRCLGDNAARFVVPHRFRSRLP